MDLDGGGRILERKSEGDVVVQHCAVDMNWYFPLEIGRVTTCTSKP